MLSTLIDISGVDAKPVYDEALGRPSDEVTLYGDTSRLKALGWTQRYSLRETLQGGVRRLGQESSRLRRAIEGASDSMGEAGAIRLSVIIAVYSETDSLVETIRRVEAADEGFLHEIILTVAPRSSDECLQLCERLDADKS